MTAKSRRVTVGGLNVQYLEAGDGPTLLLLHGLGSSGYLEWRFNLLRLARKRHVVAIDLPGYGTSERPDHHRYSVPFFIDFLAQFLDVLGAGPVDVAGVSFGGRLALGLALDEPGRVRSLTVVNALGLGRPNPLPTYLLMTVPRLGEWIFEQSGRVSRRLSLQQLRALNSLRFHDRRRGREVVDRESVDYVQTLMDDPAYHRAYLATVRSVADFWRVKPGVVVLDRLHRIEVPTLIIWGANDPIFPVRHAREAAARLPHARLEVIDHCGHTPQVEQPELFNRTLLDFLSTASPAG
ncbi:MAG: alpha/beta fold hydrolase [Candidatus Dormibacteria bacterium]